MKTQPYETITDKQNLQHKINGKCMCEACSCGRHHCPDPIKHGEYNSSYNASYPNHEGYKPEGKYNMIHKNFILPNDKFYGQSSYVGDYHKRANAEPTKIFVPKGELSLSKDPFDANTSYIQDYLNKGPGQRASPIPHPKNQILPQGKFDSSSNYNENYVGSKTKRPDKFVPVGQLKTGDGNFEGVSSYNQDFDNRGMGVKAERVPLPKNQVMPEGKFEGLSNYTDNFIPSKGEKLQQFRPEGQLKVGGTFQGASSYGADYSSRGPGARAQKVSQPKNHVMPQGKFDGETQYHQTFIPNQYERPQQFRRSGELKVGGQPFVGNSSYLDDYLHRGNGVKAQRVPLPKNQVMPEGKFEGNSENHANYIQGKTERTQQFRPEGQLKVGDGIFEGKSSYGADYDNRGVGVRNQRVPLPRNQIMPQGKFEGNSAYSNDFKNTKMEKNPQYRPVGELKVGEGRFDGATSYSNDYLNKGNAVRAERVPLPKNQVMPEGKFEGGSNYAQNYIKGEMQKNPQYRPVGQLKVGQGKFEGRSTYGQNYIKTDNSRREYCPVDTLQGPRTQIAETEHVRYNQNTHRWQ